ncbi:hypothetical protein V6N13_023107 [Hibiscus sabdariffa]|uniref:Uncharacterized protein n=2 Tax=Hibiscus sabdariffa TaxID=183260 RepID=A0ABR2NWP7_9ROSI
MFSVNIVENLEAFQAKVSSWNVDNFGHIRKRKIILLQHICDIEKALNVAHIGHLINPGHQLQYGLDSVLLQEESLWIQKLKSQWLIKGDHNSKFYHAFAMSRHRVNFVNALRREDGSWCIDKVELQSMASTLYTSMFTSNPICNPSFAISGCFSIIPHSALKSLDRVPCVEKIRDVVFSMGSFKAHEIDGFHVVFF